MCKINFLVLCTFEIAALSARPPPYGTSWNFNERRYQYSSYTVPRIANAGFLLLS